MIADSGNTVGSLFYTWMDLKNSGQTIDGDFLKKGLARNEDDYYIATGKELAQLWHTPGYYLNQDVLDTSSALHYVFVGTEFPVQYRISQRGGGSFDALEVADSVLNHVTAGSLITLTLGREKGQDEYVYRLLPYILDELIRKGFTLVDLQKMIETSSVHLP